jgi:membrane protein DedA with SNARE-associated domain
VEELLEELLGILIFKGYLIFFLWILVNRLGLPLPATPALLAAGALVAMGHWRISPVLLLAVLATLASDAVWFELGRRYGRRILRILCRAALQPETSARRAEEFLNRYGANSLLYSKFIPGMNRTVLPLTGTAQIGYPRFLVYDFVGALVWSGAYSAFGYIFSDALAEAVRRSQSLGWYAFGVLLIIIAFLVIAWLVRKYLERERRRGDELRVEHVTPHEVKELLALEDEQANVKSELLE